MRDKRFYRLAMIFSVTLLLLPSAVIAADTWTVDPAQPNDSQCVSPTFLCQTIGAAIAGALGGDTINVLPGTFSENLIVSTSLTFNGAQAGVDACDRSATESIIAGTLKLQGGSAGTVIDGFTFQGESKQIESTSGPIDNLQLLNNRHVDFTASGVFLNDNGVDITVDQCFLDGTSSTSGGIFHLDQNNFDGFQMTDSCLVNAISGFGFFVDGNRNVGISANRAPLFDGNLFDGNQQSMNMGKRALEGATISNNTFRNDAYDGLIGGPKDTLITQNVFENNGRRGLRLTAFTDADAAKGPINTTVTQNCFTGNGFVQTNGAAISFGPLSPNVGTNFVNNNNIEGNVVGMINFNPATVDGTNNWWGASDGPSGPDGAGSGDGLDGTNGGGSVTFNPFLAARAAGAPNCAPAPVPAASIWAVGALTLMLMIGLGYGLSRRKSESTT